MSLPSVRLSEEITGHYTSWVSPFGHPRIKVCLATPRGFSQLATPFIACLCLGILHVLLVAFPHSPCGEAARPISIGRLHTLLCFHRRPINLVVYKEPLEVLPPGIPSLGEGFPLICFQRLSLPHVATRQCLWRNNRYTSGASNPVLSY